ncbi:MAG: hypothetical protein LC130_15175 [Bryobacterales bacterium]|nr:hypothetical protein [Bryobacterales bacterium]
MKGKLWLLNIVLLALVLWLGSRLRQDWLAARAREAKLLEQTVKALPAPPVAPAAPVNPVTAASYAEVAQMMLFSKDRNPNVVIEAAEPAPMPALPVAHGVMDFGRGPTVFLSEKPGGPQRGYQVGEAIGQFKLLAANNREIAFEWNGETVTRTLDELMDKSKPAETAEAAPSPAASAPKITSAATTVSAGPAASGPGADIGAELKACQPGDTSPSGTVQGGMRKVVTKTPFGESCRWEPVK